MSDVEIRDLRDIGEYEACAHLQIDVWGFEPIEVVPGGHLIAMHHYGGTCCGAFDGEHMVGFVCGFPGWDGERLFHHSHMLAVRAEYRGRGIGEGLKWAQRDRVLAQRVDMINWTFDPLQAPNANLNINRLGCIARHYIVNLYGESASPLHGGLPTDRFEAEWHLESDKVLAARDGNFGELSAWASLPRANRATERAGSLLACGDELDLSLDVDAFLIQVPKTITDLMAADAELALDWRLKTRQLFQHYFAKSYRVVALHRDDCSAYYRLVRE